MPYLKQLQIRGRVMRFPAYFPDATRAVIRSLDSQDLLETGLEGLILNPYHMLSQPGLAVIRKFGGVRQYMNWPGFVVTDSGGWQLLSLVYKDQSFGKVTDRGVVFYRDSLGRSQKQIFTPEKSVQLQFDLDSDLVICLDDCPARNANRKETERAVWRTIEWAKRSKAEYEKQLGRDRISKSEIRSQRPLLFAVVQGGLDKKLRQKCAQELIKIGFDGYGWGGWSISQNRLSLKIGKFIADNLPPDKPKFALGVGYPWDVIDCAKIGYHIFDCVLPTRDARHGRLYIWARNPSKINILKTGSRNLFKFFYPAKEKYGRDRKPVDSFCDCRLCQNYSRAYLQHLFKIGDSLAWRLTTLHNLRVYARTTQLLRKQIN